METKSEMRNLGVDASLIFDHFALLKHAFFSSQKYSNIASYATFFCIAEKLISLLVVYLEFLKMFTLDL